MGLSKAASQDSTSPPYRTDPRRLIIVRIVWALLALANIGVFVFVLRDDFWKHLYGCLCDSLRLVDKRDGAIILFPRPDGPAAGLIHDGDILVAVDGLALPATISPDEVIALTNAGEVGTFVTLTVRSGDAPAREISLTRTGYTLFLRGGLQFGLSRDTIHNFLAALDIILLVSFAAVALLIAWRRSDDWMALYAAWALTGLALFVSTTFGLYLGAHYSSPLSVYWGALSLLLYNFGVLFPDGRYTPRWTLAAAVVFGGWQFIRYLGILPMTALVAQSMDVLGAVSYVGIAIYRYRHVFTPIRRQQTKWVLFGIVAGLLISQVFVEFTILLYQPLGQFRLAAYLSFSGLPIFYYAPFLLIPLSFFFAVLRYRLFDIDLVINRSIVYGSVSLGLAFIFAASVFVLEQFLGGANPLIAFGVSAIGPALLFNPARKQVQHFIDRRFYGFRFDLNELNQAQSSITIQNPGALTGRTLGTYHLLGVLGKGGMGGVYLAT